MSEREEEAMWLEEEARRLERAWRLRFMTSCMQVELPQKPTDILRPFGGMSQIAHLRLFGIHSTKYDEFLFCTLSICSSTSLVDMRPRKSAHAVR